MIQLLNYIRGQLKEFKVLHFKRELKHSLLFIKLSLVQIVSHQVLMI